MITGAKTGQAFASAREQAARENRVRLSDLPALGANEAFYRALAQGWQNLLVLQTTERERRYYLRLVQSFGRDALLASNAPLTLSTVHGVKGEEREHVILCTDLSRRAWRQYTLNPEPERRVMYVGITRAKQSLALVNRQTRRGWMELGGYW